MTWPKKSADLASPGALSKDEKPVTKLRKGPSLKPSASSLKMANIMNSFKKAGK